MSVLELSKQLIERESVTPTDAGCQAFMAERLSAMGFACESMRFGEVDNLWAVRGTKGPLFAFAGHTDVVPTGDVNDWNSPPFEPEVREGFLYGRGSADMKCSLAAMLLATEAFVNTGKADSIRLAYLLTSDEEGPAVDGTVKVMQALHKRGEHIDYCVVGEPSSSEHVGDVVKNGRRGSMSGRLTVHGVQGHIAYPHMATNPIPQAMPALTALCDEVWDEGSEFFQPSSFQISNINAGTGAGNVTPGNLICDFNFRFSPALDTPTIQARVKAILDSYAFNYTLDWTVFGQPFITGDGKLLDAAQKAIQQITGINPEISTGGGTSDGRFIAPYGTQLIELGPVNDTIHKVNECVKVSDLEKLVDIYAALLAHISG
ncbi:MAG: succinyl-diaminopimelate desuccinylase [Pseudomonadales bacterium]